jgi:solute carrier family 45 protein 1/2/4
MFSAISGASIAGERMTVVVATMFTFFFWFGTQPIQCCIRSLIFDVCPTNQQERANAWANRCSSIANIIAYFVASVNLQGPLATSGDSQFKIMSVLASLCLAITITTTCIFIAEDDNYLAPVRSKKNEIFKKICETYRGIKATPKQVIIVLVVQFFAWFGWFPYLFYVTP